MKNLLLPLIIALGLVTFAQAGDVTVYDYQSGQFYNYDV